MILRRFERFTSLYLWYILYNGVIGVYGLPYMILSSTRSKCFSVIAPHGQTITIEYDAPDLQTPDDGLAAATKRNEPDDGREEEEKLDSDGMDSQWNKRMKERLERIKSKKLRDTSVTVSQKGGSIAGTSNNKQRSGYDATGKLVTSGSGRVREELSDRNGRIEYLTGEEGGMVEICVQSILASTRKPARFYIRILDVASDQEYDNGLDDNDDDDRVSRKQQEQAKTKDPDHLEHKDITTKMSRLERDLQTLQNRVKACLNNADYNKEQEALFHEQSISMNRASKYWPIIQLTVLIVTGFTQANHIVRYLK